MSYFPAPLEIGAPSQYRAWRPHQPGAIAAITDAKERFVGAVLPTGAGKSLIVVGAALLANWRTCVLTSTKLLQEQSLRDAAEIGMVEIKGQGNYECIAFKGEYRALREKSWHGCDDGPCRAGHACIYKPNKEETHSPGCLYYDAVDAATRAQLVVTNYKYWLSNTAYQASLGRFDCLVLDEAHHAPMELANYLAVELEPGDFQLLGSGGPQCEDARAWAEWAKGHIARLQRVLEQRPLTRAELKQHRLTRKTAQKLTALAERGLKGQWVVTPHGQTWAFNPVWVADFAEASLFHAIPHVVFTSATFSRKTAAMLGVGDGRLHWHEAPSDFPPERRPVIFVPTVRLDYRAHESEIRLWLATIDNALRRRQDRKGIIHAVSYARARQIAEYSEFKARMIVHDSRGTRDAVARFKAAGPGAVLVSPAVTTGYDFPGDQCEFQIIVKIPFPDKRDPVTAARSVQDPQYPSYVAMQELVQAVGRGMRSAEDRCEVLILDSNASWFIRNNRELFPSWFMQAYRRAETLPDPPEKL